MNENQLVSMVNKLISFSKENEYVEFKENYFNKENIGKRISAISNSANLFQESFGYLVFGVKDEIHEIVGTSFIPSKEKVGNMELENWLMQMLNPKIDFRIYEFNCNGKNLVLFKIPAAINRPVAFMEVPYIRIGSITRPLKEFPDKERKIWNNEKNRNFEKGIAKENLNINEVLELLDYSEYFSLTNQPLPSETSKFLEKMEQDKLIIKTSENNFSITNLGATLFAKNIKNFESIKRKSVRVIVYKENDRMNILKEQEGVKGYAIGFKGLVDYINDKLPHNEEITKTFRVEKKMYPEVAIREFVANALIHQDLSITGASPMIEIFNNRIEITNPGEPLISVDRFIDHPPRSRNEDLAAFMRRLGICEEGGTGVDRAIISIELFQLPAPKFESYDNFTKVTLYSYKELKDMSSDDKIRACYQHCVLKYLEGKKMTNETLRNRLGIEKTNYPTASKIISDTIKKGFIKESDKLHEYIPIWA